MDRYTILNVGDYSRIDHNMFRNQAHRIRTEALRDFMRLLSAKICARDGAQCCGVASCAA